MTTIVTALFDINRKQYGDGRSFEKYLEWLPETLSLSSNYVIYTEDKVVPYIPKKDNIKVIVSSLEEVPLYHKHDQIESILKNPEYLNKIKDPHRVECVLPLYNIIQYSKFEWLKRTIKENPFNSSYFFWMDAGCSRFFDNLPNSFPNPDKLPPKFLIQGNANTNRIVIDDSYKWMSDCVLVGTFFGGHYEYVTKVSDLTLQFLQEEMLDQNMINNEQIALAYICKRNPSLFNVYIQLNGQHLPVLKILV
jgi:hypothetical protein